MIAVDGRFYRADVDGAVHEVSPSTKTPFAVMVFFTPTAEVELDGPLAHDELLARLDELVPAEPRPARCGSTAASSWFAPVRCPDRRRPTAR